MRVVRHPATGAPWRPADDRRGRRLRRARTVRAALPLRDVDPSGRPPGGVRRVRRGRAARARRPPGDFLRRMNRVLGDPPFNFMLHTAPLRGGELESFHWHREVIPKLTRVAGFEWGSGFFINPLPPEDAAAALRAESS